MIKSTSLFAKLLSVLVSAFALTAISAQPAAAQTAKKLVCEGCVKSKQLKNNAIKSKDIKDGQVGTPDLADNAVSSDKIAADAVLSSQVQNESLTAIDLGDEAGANFVDNAVIFDLVDGDQLVESVSVSAPAAGVVIVIASGNFRNDMAAQSRAFCTITTGTVTDLAEQEIFVRLFELFEVVPLAGTRGFEVPAGTTTFNLVCNQIGGDIRLFSTKMTAMYFPTRY